MKLFTWLKVLILLGMISSLSMAQTIHQVAEGDSTLAAAIADATDGDIIELITDGGLFTNPNQIEIDKSLTIRAHADLVTKPVIKYIGTSTSANLFKVTGSSKVVFDGLELDGDGTTNGAADKAKYAIRFENTELTDTMNIMIDNCFIHDYKEAILKPYPATIIDSFKVHNSILADAGKEGILFYSGSTSDAQVELGYGEVKNCTFYNIKREAVKGDTNPNTKILVDHCTMYNIGGNADKPFIYVDDALDVVVKNSVFQMNTESGNHIRLKDAAGSFVNNCVIWDVADWEIDNATVTDTLRANPLFADAVNYDFTLQAGSPAIGYADDGSAAGDSRWDPTVGNATVHKVEAGTDVLKSVIDMAAAGDTIELVTSGGLYLSADQMVIDKDLVIRGRAGLSEKPILKYIGAETGAYMFKVVASPKVVFNGIELDGDGTAEGGAALAKYALRLDNGDPSLTMNVRVNDCVMHDFNEKIIKPYGDCGMDSLFIHNSVFYNGAKEGIVFYSGSTSDPAVSLEYAEVINCTFYNFAREAIKGETNPDTKILVDRCTFYNIGGPDKPFIYVDDALDVVIKNSVFQKNLEDGNHIRLEDAAGSFVSNCVIWDVFHKDIDNATVTDTLFADPLFADADNGDFTLDAASPARTAGEGGLPVGDSRWAIDPNSKVLAVVTEGNGIVNLDPAGGIYAPGTSVTMTAVPDLGWEFDGWTGISVFPPDQNPTTIVVNDNVTATATFKNLTPQVALTIDSLGLGSVVVNPEAGDDGTFDQASTVKLTAVPATDWEFVEWLGDISSTDNPVSVSLDSNMTVTASYRSTFTQFALNATIVGNGELVFDPMPVIDTYDTNTVVTITAVPAIGWSFEGWAEDLLSTSLTDSVTMNSDKNITATFIENVVPGGILEIDSTWDFMDAVDFANNNSSVHTLLLTTSGLYTTNKSGTVTSRHPLTIMAAEGLSKKPVISNTDPASTEGTIDILRVFDDITIKGIVIDGSTNYSAGMKYAVRYSNSTAPDTVKWGSNATFIDVDFRHLYDDGKETGDGHAFKVDANMILGVVKFEGCTFNDIGYEAIRISDTEKWSIHPGYTGKCFDSLIVRNCTFTNIDAEGIRYYSDLDPATPDAPVLVEHVTFNNTATRTMYLKNSGGAVIRDIIISNPRTSGHGRDADLMDAQGQTGIDTYISDINLFNTGDVPIGTVDNVIDSATIYNIDPMYKDAANMDYTLLPASHLYGLAHDGEAMGDLRWATEIPTSVSLEILAENGNVTFSPLPIGKTYDPGTVVTVSAVADTGYMFVEWSGDLSGSDNPASITMDGDKYITANFDIDTGVEDFDLPKEFALTQNYPNPFNPSTTIRFALPTQAVVSLRVYNILGQLVTTLFNNESMTSGYHNVKWNSHQKDGSDIATGLYIYRLNAKGLNGKEFVKSMKMMLLK
ncbi:MAG: DUF5123 domain-containing protein [Melioribacteraceae bacterium]|nr:DUF5123 domain-containing protein [Melioribacteraceae bacterium]